MHPLFLWFFSYSPCSQHPVTLVTPAPFPEGKVQHHTQVSKIREGVRNKMRELENWMETSVAQVKVLKSKTIFFGRCHFFRYDQALHENFG